MLAERERLLLAKFVQQRSVGRLTAYLQLLVAAGEAGVVDVAVVVAALRERLRDEGEDESGRDD